MKLKHIEVYEEDHKLAKENADKRGMSLRAYINWVLDKDRRDFEAFNKALKG